MNDEEEEITSEILETFSINLLVPQDLSDDEIDEIVLSEDYAKFAGLMQTYAQVLLNDFFEVGKVIALVIKEED